MRYGFGISVGEVVLLQPKAFLVELTGAKYCNRKARERIYALGSAASDCVTHIQRPSTNPWSPQLFGIRYEIFAWAHALAVPVYDMPLRER